MLSHPLCLTPQAHIGGKEEHVTTRDIHHTQDPQTRREPDKPIDSAQRDLVPVDVIVPPRFCFGSAHVTSSCRRQSCHSAQSTKDGARAGFPGRDPCPRSKLGNPSPSAQFSFIFKSRGQVEIFLAFRVCCPFEHRNWHDLQGIAPQRSGIIGMIGANASCVLSLLPDLSRYFVSSY